MNSDCFAAATRSGQPYCLCLNEVVCHPDKPCTFYKSKLKYLHDLVEHNGTTDLRQISENYAAGHVDREGESK